MGDDQRISHLNSLLNAAVSHKNRNEAVYKDAYNRLMQNIEKAINEEQNLAKLSREKTLNEDNVVKERENFKKKLVESHKTMLKKQMQEKQVLKSIEKEKDLEPHISQEFEGYPHHPEEPETEVMRKKRLLQEEFKKGLQSQIEEKQMLNQRQTLQAENIDRLRIETAKVSLEQEKQKVIEKQQEHLSALTASWKRDLDAKELLNKVKRLTKLLNKTAESRDSEWTSSSQAAQDFEPEEAKDTLETSHQEPAELTKELLDYLRKRSASLSASKASSVSSRISNRSPKARSIRSSRISQQEAYEKLDQLEKQEEEIRKQKEELLKNIAASTQRSNASSRMTTVSNLMTRVTSTPSRRTAEAGRQVMRPLEETKASAPKPVKSLKAPRKGDEVNDMLRSLFN